MELFNWPVGVVNVADDAGGLGSIPESVKSDTVAKGSPPLLRFCVAQALYHGDRPATRYTLR